jgi:hypothetical protein
MTSRSRIRLLARTARTPARLRLRLEALEDRSCPSVFYDFNPIASTGTIIGGQTLTALGSGPAVNDLGAVAFTGTSAAGQGLYVGGTGEPVTISAPAANITFGPQLSINNAGAIAQAASIPSLPMQVVILWSGASSPGTGRNVASTSVAGLGGLGLALDTNNSGDVVYTSTFNGRTTLNYWRADLGTSTAIAQLTTAQTLLPSVSDARSVVVRTSGALGQTAIDLYAPRADGSYATTVIASPTNGFTTLGAEPGISADGSIVVFAGSKGKDQGIWASIAGDNGTRSLERLTGGLIDGKNNPELGYNASGKAIYLKSFNLDQPVRVARQDLQPVGSSLDSFVVTFQATPSSASIPNPTPGVTRPLLFTARTGIWSERVDEERQTEAPNNVVWHRTSPLPVVQIGDLVDGKTVASLGGAALANASTDITAPSNPTRIQRRGDHQVVFWAQAGDGTQMVVLGRHLDSSQDGLLDFWKTKGIDIDQDGIVDFKLSDWGAKVGQRDLFLEMDWTTPRMENGAVVWKDEPVAGATAALANMFANAPAVGSGASTIPAGITLHIDGGSGKDSAGNPFSQNTGTGQLFGGQLIGMPNDPSGHPDIVYMGKPLPTNTFDGLQVRSLNEIKQTYLGPASEKDARELVFHYLVLADFLENGILLPTAPAGLAEADWRPGPNNSPFPGNDSLLAVGVLRRHPAVLSVEWQVMAHELGHNLGLRHHGINHTPVRDGNYRSLMSYTYTGEVGGTVKSYGTLTVHGKVVWNDWDNLRLDFQSAFNHLGNSFKKGGLRETE